MRRTKAAVAALTFCCLVPLGPAPAGAQDNTAAQILSRLPSRHPPARVRVHPLARSYPGPDAVRQCTAWLAPEYRPSGTVVVPKMHCWWERG